jgi:sialate O-acetylesterase
MAVLSWVAVGGLAWADVKPNAVCSDGMVLQQKAKTGVWGTADKGEKVTVTFRDKTYDATADDNGKWIVKVDTGAAGGPFPMTIKGNNTLEYKNVMVGEVWICSGQSNMEMHVGSCDKSDKDYAHSAAANPKLRMFTVGHNPQPQPVDNVNGSWVEAAPDKVDGFSAVAYFFGCDLQHRLDIPIGLIHTSIGGTPAEAWTSKAALTSNDLFKNLPFKDKVGQNDPAALYNGMIYPLLSYGIKGSIWYQGESNAGRAFAYRTLFPLMIENWRKDFNQGDFPFYFVQLAPFGTTPQTPGDSNWAELREAQTMTLKLKNTGMAVITDFGNEYDIHPTPKRPVGERLALVARANTYGEKVEYSGPMFDKAAVEGDTIVLSFKHLGNGLTSFEMEPTLEKGGKFAYRAKSGSDGAPLVGFTICGEDKKFHPAKAEIKGDKIVVRSAEVARPVAVRYAWADHPVCNLFNKDGLPASPFRTDDFPGITQPKN